MTHEAQPQDEQPRAAPRSRAWPWVALAAVVLVPAFVVAHEVRTSEMQARYFSKVASEMRYRVDAGPSASIAFPRAAPYDDRLGYSALPAWISRLEEAGFRIEAQARQTDALMRLIAESYSPPYR